MAQPSMRRAYVVCDAVHGRGLMSKNQRGNKEAKKPKQERPSNVPVPIVGIEQSVGKRPLERGKKA